MELKWTSKALSDITRLYEFLALANQPAAARVVQQLTTAPTTLLTNPRIGERLDVTACNRNGLDLQSSRFSTGIDCVYPAPRTSIDCKRTCIQPLRPAIERNRPGLNATEKPMIYRPSDSGLQELG